MSTQAPTLYSHDVRLAGSEHGDSSPPSKFDEGRESRARLRRQQKHLAALVPTLPTTSTSSSSSSSRRPDVLDHAINYLKKRDGIDKVLKVARYAAKFLLAVNQSSRKKKAAAAASAHPAYAPSPSSGSSPLLSYSPPPPFPSTPKSSSLYLLRLDDEPLRKLNAFESAVGDARKAYRMGKFLQGIDAARKAAPAAMRLSPAGVLAFVAAAGDGCYYFLDQFTFFVRAGVLHKSYARRISRAAAVAELVGYFGSASLSAAAISACSQREAELVAALRRSRKLDLLTDSRDEEEDSGGDGEGEGCDGGEARGRRSASERRATTASVERELSSLSSLRRSRERALAQDACDALLAFSDLSDGKGAISGNPTVLAAAGLASALLGGRKVWG